MTAQSKVTGIAAVTAQSKVTDTTPVTAPSKVTGGTQCSVTAQDKGTNNSQAGPRCYKAHRAIARIRLGNDKKYTKNTFVCGSTPDPPVILNSRSVWKSAFRRSPPSSSGTHFEILRSEGACRRRLALTSDCPVAAALLLNTPPCLPAVSPSPLSPRLPFPPPS